MNAVPSDQYNVWIQRWVGLASGDAASSHARSAIVGLSTLAVLLGPRPPEPDFLRGVSPSKASTRYDSLNRADRRLRRNRSWSNWHGSSS